MHLPVFHLLAALAVVVSGVLLPRLWRLLDRRPAQPARTPSAASAERRARAMMSELCPHGWHAEITLREGPLVTLQWCELRPGGEEPAVMRQVRAASVADALEAMVSDRLTDQALEQIESRAAAAGARWPDD